MIMPITHHNKDLLIGVLRYGHQCYWELCVRIISPDQSMNSPPPIHLHLNLVLVLLRLWLLRNRNQKFIFATLILFVIAHVATITCVVIVLVNANREYPFSVWRSMDRTTEIIWLMLSITNIWPRADDVHDDASKYIGLIIRPCSKFSPRLPIRYNSKVQIGHFRWCCTGSNFLECITQAA